MNYFWNEIFLKIVNIRLQNVTTHAATYTNGYPLTLYPLRRTAVVANSANIDSLPVNDIPFESDRDQLS